MQFKLATIAILASMASAKPFASSSASPSSSASISPSSSASISSTATPSASATPSSVNPDDFDCVYRGRGCDWMKSEYGYGSDYCGSSPFEAGQKLSDGGVVLAVSKDGSGDCASKAGKKCCQVLADQPCKHGEKYLECPKPQ